MKIILSKKGVDSSNFSEPIEAKEGEELFFMPIPSLKEKHKYQDIMHCPGKSLLDVANENCKNGKFKIQIPIKTLQQDNKVGCHLDPQVKDYFGQKKFLASFGQAESAQSYLENNEVGLKDLFLFFGWYYDIDEKRDKQVIWGYMQVGDILTFQEDGKVDSKILGQNLSREYVESKYPFLKNQPHWINKENYPYSRRNTIYIASEFFNNDHSIKGFGVFKYDKEKELDLTAKNAKCKSQWQVERLKNVCVQYKKGNGEQYQFDDNGYISIAKGFGQEFVIDGEKAEKWAFDIIKTKTSS